MTTQYRYIGKGVTDSNGIAHMTEDADGQSCSGYTGTGRGLTDIIASTDDSTHISDSSLQSEIYSLWDTLWYDSNSRTWVGDAPVTYVDGVRIMDFTGVVNLYPTENNNRYFISSTEDFIVEFEYIGNTQFSFYFPTSSQSYNMGLSSKYNWYNKKLKFHVKVSDNETDVYIDDVYSETVSNTREFTSNCGFQVRRINAISTTLGLKDLKIYSA